MAKAKRSKKVKKPKMETDVNAELDALGPVADYPAGRIAWWRDRVAIIDRHRKRSRVTDVERAQERHSPTVEIAVDDPEATRKVRKNLTRVRQSEAWRHNQLSGLQREAEREIELAYRANGGPQAAVAKYGSVGGQGDGGIELSAEIAAAWRDWNVETGRRRINKWVVIDCVSEPRTLAEIERSRRLAPGKALSHYTRGLSLWCELRGWVRPHSTIA